MTSLHYRIPIYCHDIYINNNNGLLISGRAWQEISWVYSRQDFTGLKFRAKGVSYATPAMAGTAFVVQPAQATEKRAGTTELSIKTAALKEPHVYTS